MVVAFSEFGANDADLYSRYLAVVLVSVLAGGVGDGVSDSDGWASLLVRGAGKQWMVGESCRCGEAVESVCGCGAFDAVLARVGLGVGGGCGSDSCYARFRSAASDVDRRRVETGVGAGGATGVVGAAGVVAVGGDAVGARGVDGAGVGVRACVGREKRKKQRKMRFSGAGNSAELDAKYAESRRLEFEKMKEVSETRVAAAELRVKAKKLLAEAEMAEALRKREVEASKAEVMVELRQFAQQKLELRRSALKEKQERMNGNWRGYAETVVSSVVPESVGVMSKGARKRARRKAAAVAVTGAVDAASVGAEEAGSGVDVLKEMAELRVICDEQREKIVEMIMERDGGTWKGSKPSSLVSGAGTSSGGVVEKPKEGMQSDGSWYGAGTVSVESSISCAEANALMKAVAALEKERNSLRTKVQTQWEELASYKDYDVMNCGY